MSKQIDLFDEDEDVYSDPYEEYIPSEEDAMFILANQELIQSMYIPVYWQDLTPIAKFRIYEDLQPSIPFEEFELSYLPSDEEPIAFTSPLAFTVGG
jgi:hypothetical protein